MEVNLQILYLAIFRATIPEFTSTDLRKSKRTSVWTAGNPDEIQTRCLTHLATTPIRSIEHVLECGHFKETDS